jgi:hypothetical protein
MAVRKPLGRLAARANGKFKPALSVPPRVPSLALTSRLGRSEHGVAPRGMPADSGESVLARTEPLACIC